MRKRGFTLVEVLVATGVAGVVLTVIAFLFTMLHTMSRVQSEVSDTSRAQAVLQRRLEALFRRTNPDGIYLNSSRQSLVIQTLHQVTTGASLPWERDVHVLHYEPEERTLTLRKVSLTKAGLEPENKDAFPMTDGAVTDLLNTQPDDLKIQENVENCIFFHDETNRSFQYLLTSEFQEKSFQHEIGFHIPELYE